MRRRHFIAGVGSAAVMWPIITRAQQQAGRMRRIGILTGGSGADSQARLRVFLDALPPLGWIEGRNVEVYIRQGGGDPNAIRKGGAELVDLAPDVLVANGGTATLRLIQATATIPIVFAFVPDPVGSGFVQSLARPGGNATGFMQFEYSLSGKWLELLKEMVPGVRRAAVLRDPTVPAGIGQFAIIQAVAASLQIEVSPINVRDPVEIERDIAALAQQSDVGLIVASSTNALVHRNLIVELAARHKLPTIYSQREFVVGGGLVSYAADFNAQLRNAAVYVNRILKGEKPSDLPVQAPTKYELVINLKTAKSLGLDIPTAMIVRADELIE
jgi:putative ABC transport system substrate-binding protein